MTTTFDIGDRPRITATFTDIDGAAATPSTIVVRTRNPSGIETTYTSPNAAITTPAVGTVRFMWPAPLDQAGVWAVRIAGTAGLEAAAETTFRVAPSTFATP